ADAADEGSRPTELRKRNDCIGHGTTADQLGFVFLIPLQQRLLLGEIDELHAAAFEAERSKLLIRDFKENIDEGIAQSAEFEFFHGVVGAVYDRPFFLESIKMRAVIDR